MGNVSSWLYLVSSGLQRSSGALMLHAYNVCFFVETWSVRLIANLFSTFPHRKTFLSSKWAKKLQKLSQKWAATVAIGGSKSTDIQRPKWSFPRNTSSYNTKKQSHRWLPSLEARLRYYKLPRALSRRLHVDYYTKKSRTFIFSTQPICNVAGRPANVHCPAFKGDDEIVSRNYRNIRLVLGIWRVILGSKNRWNRVFFCTAGMLVAMKIVDEVCGR